MGGSLNDHANLILQYILNIQPAVTTALQAYEWESMSTIIEEQKAKCMEEALEHMNKDDNKAKFKKKEIKNRTYFILYVTLTVLGFVMFG